MFIVFTGFNSFAETPKDELKIAKWEDINTLDPAYLTSMEREFTIMNCIYNGLAKYKEGTWEVVPDLAESWDVSKDGKEITFYLRKGVQFQKGYGEMTAEDVKFSFERIIDPKNNCSELVSWTALDHVGVIDKYTAKLVLKYPSARLFTSTLPMNSGFIVSKKAVEEMGKEKFASCPIGTGPYEFVVWEPKSKLELKAFKGYWGEPPKTKNLTFVPITEASTVEMALKTGEIDVGEVTTSNFDLFQKNPDFNVYPKPICQYWWIGFTLNKPPFDNLKARQAIRYALNVDDIINAQLYGCAVRIYSYIPEGILGYWEDTPRYQQDLKKAKQLLGEAGYPNGFEITLLIEPEFTIMGEVIKAQLEKIGVEVDIDVREIGAFNEGTNKGETECYIQFFGATVDPGYNSQWWLSSSTWNPSQYRVPEFDSLFELGEREMDLQKRAEIYIEMQKMIDKSAWAIWLCAKIRPLVTDKSVNLGKLSPDGHLYPWLINK
jgi:peptide/nickel transport system substrate-binding protein